MMLGGTLYEAWQYQDGRPDVYGVDCQPVRSLPTATAWDRAARDQILAAMEVERPVPAQAH